MHCRISVQTVILGIETVPIVPIYWIHIVSPCYLCAYDTESELRAQVQTDPSQDPPKISLSVENPAPPVQIP